MITADEIRQLALSLPGVEERETWGEATFRVRDKIFFMLSPGEQEASLRTSLEEQDVLVNSHSESFSPAHYTGRYGWVHVELSTVDPDLMCELVIKTWRRTAPRRLVAEYDAVN
ncbi:MAG: MmcQ/YjbR family DNA-binding protein [Chloroflexia bacterium]